MSGFTVKGGNVSVSSFGSDKWAYRTRNTVTSGALSLVRDWLANAFYTAMPLGPTYLAVGSGVVSTGLFMTAVPGEHYRVQVVSRDKSGSDVIFHAFLDELDAQNSVVACFGLFGGDATNSPNSGTLFVVASGTAFNKNATNTVSWDWTVTVA